MGKTQLLKSQHTPSVQLWHILVVQPEEFVSHTLSIDEPQIELAETISQFISRRPLVTSKGLIPDNEIARNKHFKNL